MTTTRFVRGDCSISCDPADVDLDAVHAFLSRAYWSEGIPRELVARAIAGSLPFSLRHDTTEVRPPSSSPR